MSSQLKLRRGTSAGHASFTGAEGEATYDVTEKRLVAHDGVTPGGMPAARTDEVSAPMRDLAALRAYSGNSLTSVRILDPIRQGVFDLDTTDRKSKDDDGLVVVDAAGRRWKRVVNGSISVRWFGARGDGVTDDTQALQKAFLGAGTIDIPSGKYLVSASVRLASNTTVHNRGVLLWAAKRNPPGAAGILSGTRVSDISLHDMQFHNASANDGVVGVTLAACHRVNMVRPIATECSVVRSDAFNEKGGSAGYRDVITDRNSARFNCSTEIHVSDVKCTGRGPDRHLAACEFFYTLGWSVRGGVIDNIRYGVQWWGGDSDHGRDGAVAAERKNKNGVVTGLRVTNGHAGIWGSMGEAVQVSGCHVSHHSDVGIDPEGCFNMQIHDNYAAHCDNGCFAGFFFNRDVSFKHNIAVQDGSRGVLLFQTYNSSNAPVPEYEVVGNTWRFQGAKGVGLVHFQSGLDTMTYDGNKHNDVIMSCGGNNMGTQFIENNLWHYSRPLAANTECVRIGWNHGRQLSVVNNAITSSVEQRAQGVVALTVTQDDYNSSPPSRLYTNTINGFQNAIRLTGASKNPSIQMSFTVVENSFTGSFADASPKGRAVVHRRSNRDFSGRPRPDEDER